MAGIIATARKMKTQIDKMNDASKWVPSAGAVLTETEQPWYVASDHGRALRVSFAGPGEDIVHTPAAPVDVTEAEFFSLSLSGEPEEIGSASDFPLDITFTGQNADGAVSVTYHAYYQAGKLPQILFYNPLTLLESVTIAANKATDFVMSDLIAMKDEHPIDIYTELARIYQERLEQYQGLLVVGSVTAVAGDTEIYIDDPQWKEQNTAIEFGGERHLVDTIRLDGTGAYLAFAEYFDGASVVSDQTDEPVSVYFPVLIEPGEDTAIVPSISLDKAMERELDMDNPWGLRWVHSYSGADDGRLSVTEKSYRYNITLNPTSRHGKDMEYIALAAAGGIGDVLWINGQPHNIVEQEDLEHQGGGDATEIMPGLSAPIVVPACERSTGDVAKIGKSLGTTMEVTR